MKNILLPLLLFASTSIFAGTPNFDTSSRIVFFPDVTVDKNLIYTDVKLLLRTNLTWNILVANQGSGPVTQEKSRPDFNLSTRIVTLPRVTVGNNEDEAYVDVELLLKLDGTWTILTITKEAEQTIEPTPDPEPIIIDLTGNYNGSTTSSVRSLLNTTLDGSLSQNGTALTGDVTLTSSLGAVPATITGQLTGTDVSLAVDATAAGYSINLDGTVSDDNRSISGSYTWPAFKDKGTWELILK